MLSLQVNFGTIHNHKVLAERFGTVAELRAELKSGEQAPQHTQLGGWLG
jgi:GTP cyclohydrolase IV